MLDTLQRFHDQHIADARFETQNGIGHDTDDWKWLLASGAAVGSFAALLAGSVDAALAFLVILALDQRSHRS